ncbi:MAG: glycosyl hydrolase 115 family protein [Draconibacterium sp.]
MEKNCGLTKILLFLITGILAFSCSNQDIIYIVTGNKASKVEILTANLFKKDLESVSGKSVSLITTDKPIPPKGTVFVIGTEETNDIIAGLVKSKDLIVTGKFPGARGGIWAKATLENGGQAIILAGSDVQGTQYAVFDYCKKILGVDPLEYWTGNLPDRNRPFDPYNFSNNIIAPPEIPILCYFENDVDELANLKHPWLEYDWESYTEMVNSLVRLKYNAIHLFDMLGRPEFFLRPVYEKIRPEYDIRLSYIDSLIDYAHDMGMKVHIDLSLGYKIKPMSQTKADCWSENKKEWIDAWQYYFEKTPIRKADIFSLRPRNQVWDWEYKSACGESKIEVFNEVYVELDKLINEYNPSAIKLATVYSDAMVMFNEGFNPPEDWIIEWSDDGWGGFAVLPETTKGYSFGTYMHAGFWKNHTIHDPYPEKIDSVMKLMVNKFQANRYWEINGQQFRPFLLNIEAFAEAAGNPEAFNGDLFYSEWTKRYFGEKASPFAINSMKKLHEAQFGKVGYVQNLWETGQILAYLGNVPIEQPGRPPVPYNFERFAPGLEHLSRRTELVKQAFDFAEQGEAFVKPESTFYYDYIVLPARLYLDLLTFENRITQMALLKKSFEETGDKEKLQEALSLLGDAKKDLDVVYRNSLEGDKNPKWAGWYDPVKRRPNNGFPQPEMMIVIEDNLNSLLK